MLKVITQKRNDGRNETINARVICSIKMRLSEYMMMMMKETPVDCCDCCG